MDWHEKWASAEKPWDRLCDQLNGRGVSSLEDALIDMELEPVHQALRQLLEQDMIRLLTDQAEHPRVKAGNGTVSVAVDRKQNRKRSELFNLAWARCEAFLRLAQPAYRSRNGAQHEPIMPGLLGPAFRERLTAAMRLPVVEALSPEPWTTAARRVLPSPSPQMTATAMWAPIIAWCAFETLAESLGAQNPEKIALDLFDQLRLRKPLAESFHGLGFEGEAGWRAAARIRVLLRAEARPPLPEITSTETDPDAVSAAGSAQPKATTAGKAKPIAAPVVGGLPRELWSDPDVRWLTGAHDAGNSTYLVLEPYEELLWWLQLPVLLNIAGSTAPAKVNVQAIYGQVRSALAEAEKAGYRLDTMLGSEKGAPKPKPATEPANPGDHLESDASTDAAESEKQPI
jgi:hypothetical protein